MKIDSGGLVMYNYKEFIRDLLMCFLIVLSIKIAENYFSHNIFADIVIVGIAIYYFGGKIIRYIKKKKNKDHV